jgi:S1-C subfamily serine protease
MLAVMLITVPAAASDKRKDPPLRLPEFVVHGTRIPAGWLTVNWNSKGPLGTDHVVRAWFSYVQPDSPAAKAGINSNDNLVAIGGVGVATIPGITLRWHLERERQRGTREEFTVQTPGGEKRIVTIRFE